MTGLTRVDVMIIAKERAKESTQNGCCAVIDFDCSNVAHLVRHKAMGVVEETAKFLMQCAL